MLSFHIGGEMSFPDILDEELNNRGKEAFVVSVPVLIPVDVMVCHARFGLVVRNLVSEDHAALVSASLFNFLCLIHINMAWDPSDGQKTRVAGFAPFVEFVSTSRHGHL